MTLPSIIYVPMVVQASLPVIMYTQLKELMYAVKMPKAENRSSKYLRSNVYFTLGEC